MPDPTTGTALDPSSWMNAGASVANPQQTVDPKATLQAAQHPTSPQPQTQSTAPANAPSVNEQPVPLALKPKRGGLLGVMDKVADALAGTTTPEIWTDGAGNEFVYHADQPRGRQWARIGAELARGAASGYAAGQGAGGEGRAALAGFQEADRNRQQQHQNENELDAKAQRDMLNKANMTMLRMNMAEQAWRASRLGIEATHQDAEFANKMADHLKSMGGVFMATAEHPGDLAAVLKIDPKLAESFVKQHLIEVLPTVDENGHKGVAFWKMPNAEWQNQMLPPGAVIHTWNPAKNVVEESQASDGMTHGEQYQLDLDAFGKQLAWQNNNQEQKLKDAQTKNLQSEADTRAKELPSKIAEQQASAARNWAEARKEKILADQASNETMEGGTIDSQAQALVDGRTVSSLLTKRKDYNEIMARADQLSVQQFGHKYDQTAGQAAYNARNRLITEYTEGDEAKSIESFDKFLGHAKEASEAVNGIRNKESRWLNVPINALAKLDSSDRGPALKAFEVKLDTLRKEFETTLKNNHALTVEDIKQGEKLMDDNATPAQLQEAMRAMAHVAAVRLRASDFKYQRTMHQHVPDLTSQEGNDALQHFGIDPKSVYSNLTHQAQPGQAPPRPANVPPNAVWNPQANNGSGAWTL